MSESAPSPSPVERQESAAPAETQSGQRNEDAGGTALGLSRSDRFFLLSAAVAILGLLTAHLVRLTWRHGETIEVVRLPEQAVRFQLEINSATWVELMQLPELGEQMARRIAADREAGGPFVSVDDLERVSGIGPRTLEKLRPFVRCETPSPD